MSRDPWFRASASLVIALALLGCDGAKLCQKCERPPKADHSHNIHHTTFAFSFAPGWFTVGQRSLFTSYVVFSKEAKFAEWKAREPGERCSEDEEGSVCPDTAFYRRMMGQFLNELANCATQQKRVELHMVGFASSTKLNNLAKKDEAEIRERYQDDIAAITAGSGGCGGKADEEKEDTSNMFNLLIANERATNTAAMLENLVSAIPGNAFDIKAIPWCSHDSMAEDRQHDDEGEVAKGLMNRRVEVRLASLPGCVNIEAEKWVGIGRLSDEPAQ